MRLLNAIEGLMTRRRILFAAAAVGVGNAIALLVSLLGAHDLITPMGTPLGGDFIAFRVAAHAAADGQAAAIYTPAAFQTLLVQNGPPYDGYGLLWQYPPHYFFFIAPLAALPYVPGYLLWSGLGLAAFLAALWVLFRRREVVWLALCAPASLAAFVTGQNGFLTASLLFIAGAQAHRRPILAGVAAGLLTVKPQLGLLIPVAFAAAGCWRAVAAAIVTGAALIAASGAVYGWEPWAAFSSALHGSGELVGAGEFPLYKMATIYAAARMAFAPAALAFALQGIATLSAAAAVAIVWRRTTAWDLRAGVLCAGALLAAPYAYFYELTLLALPMAAVALRGLDEGWKPGERLALAALWFLPMLTPGAERHHGVAWGFVIAAGAFALIARRAGLFQAGRRDFIAAASVPSSR